MKRIRKNKSESHMPNQNQGKEVKETECVQQGKRHQ